MTEPSEGGGELVRACTCHPDDNPPVPCARKYALTDCRMADLQSRIALSEAREAKCVEALTKIATFDDKGANYHLEHTGSFAQFDEPGSVQIAREALSTLSPAAAGLLKIKEAAMYVCEGGHGYESEGQALDDLRKALAALTRTER